MSKINPEPEKLKYRSKTTNQNIRFGTKLFPVEKSKQQTDLAHISYLQTETCSYFLD